MAHGDSLASYLIALGLVLIFSAFVLVYGPVPAPGSLYLFPKDVTHWVGWFAALALAASTALHLAVRSGGRLTRSLHCVLGGASLAGALYHVNARLNPFTGTPIGFWIIKPLDYSSIIILILMGVVVVSGARTPYKRPGYSRAPRL